MQSAAQLGVIWDMDGTLVDTAELHFQAWQAVCAEQGREFTRADFAATFGRRNPEIIRHLFGDRHAPAEVDALGDRKEVLYRHAARAGVELLPGVRELLGQLHEAGFRQAIGSSAPRANLDLILQLTGAGRFFQALSSMEDTQRGKPDPQVFLVAAQRLGVEPARCLVVEDAPAGLQAARAGGMKSIGVGFVGHHDAATLAAAGADLVVASLTEVSVARVQQLLSA
jgi:beta-phosphoglucomutase